MPKENLVFEVHRTEPVGNVVRINNKTRRIVNQLRRETGFSATRIIEMCMEYASENYEIKEVE